MHVLFRKKTAITQHGFRTKDSKEDLEDVFIFSVEISSEFLCNLFLRRFSLRVEIKGERIVTRRSLAKSNGSNMVVI